MKKAIAKLAVVAVVCGGALGARAAEPHCNVMQFFDAKGEILATPSPVIGMMIGDRAIYDPSVAGAVSIRPGAETACPPALIQGVRETFEMACMSDQRRKQAAADHKVDISVIDKGCSDMIKALGSETVAPK